MIEGTLAGHAFVRDEVVVSGTEPTLVWVPLSEGTERLGFWSCPTSPGLTMCAPRSLRSCASWCSC